MGGERSDQSVEAEDLAGLTWRVTITCCSKVSPSFLHLSKVGTLGCSAIGCLGQMLTLNIHRCNLVLSVCLCELWSPLWLTEIVWAHLEAVGARGGWELRGRITAAPTESSCTLPKLFVWGLDKHLGKIQPTYLCASHSQSTGTYLSETYHVPDGRIKWLFKHTVT